VTIQVGAANQPPVAVASATPTAGAAPLAVHLDGGSSYDLDGAVVSWDWQLGDGSNAAGPAVDHQYALPGSYTATLTVRDDWGASASQSVTVTVTPPDSVALASADEAATGVVSGSYLDTQAADGRYEGLTEEVSGGRPDRRKSSLRHGWRFAVPAGAAHTFIAVAHRTTNAEGDRFNLTWSRDGVTFSPMVTVDATAPAGALTFALPADAAGTLWVRAEDTDHTAGASYPDTLFVDYLAVFTTAGGADTTPPAPPAGLSAVGAAGRVDLDWADSGEHDLAGYHVYRGTSAGGPYDRLTGSPIGASAFAYSSVTGGTTYHYVVTAVDFAGNESGPSGEAVATPTGGGVPAVHIAALGAGTLNVGKGDKRGWAEVTVVDGDGTAVAGASVSGAFTGSYSEVASGVTGAGGVLTLTTAATAKGGVAFTFCVTGLTAPGYVRDPSADVATCASF